MTKPRKCEHPNLIIEAGEENEPSGDYVNPVPRVRAYVTENCPDCPYVNTFYGPWETK